MSALVYTLPTGGYIDTREVLYDVRVDTGVSGKEWRSTWASVPRTRLGVVVDVLRSDAGSREDAQATWGHFARHFGALDSFLFTDPEDYTVTAHPFGTGDGATLSFQLQRTQVTGTFPANFWPLYSSGFEPCFDLNSAPAIYVGGVLKTLATDYTVSATGLVTFVSAPASAAALAWTGTYYKRVRLNGSVSYKRIVGGMWAASFSLLGVKP